MGTPDSHGQGHQTTNSQPSDNHPAATNNNEKNEKKGKKSPPLFEFSRSGGTAILTRLGLPKWHGA